MVIACDPQRVAAEPAARAALSRTFRRAVCGGLHSKATTPMTSPFRSALVLSLGLLALVSGGVPGFAQGAPAAGQPVEIGKYDAWNAYAATAKGGKVCYALGQPASRKPGGLNRDPAYFFVSNRPKESVRNEISIVIGFPVKQDSKVELAVDRNAFELYTRADGAFMASAEEEKKLVAALKKGRSMTVKSISIRGRTTTDIYPLSGLGGAIDRIDKDCK